MVGARSAQLLPGSVARLLPRWLAVVLLGLVLLVGPFAGLARADDPATSYAVESTLANDGMLSVKATVTLGQSQPERLEQTFRTKRAAGDSSDYRYEVTDLKATADGADLGAEVKEGDDTVTISIDPKKANGKPIEISYRVKGAVRENPGVQGRDDSNTFEWAFLQGLNVGVTEVTGTVKLGAMTNFIDCRAGAEANPNQCTLWQAGTHDSPMPTFTDGPRGSNEIVQLTFGVPAASVKANAVIDEHWSLDRAFTVNWPTVLSALGALALGALLLWGLHRRAGRDEAALAHPTTIAEFAPVGEGQSEFALVTDVRPGQIGTVADERVDPIDVTGTLLDLAVRGHLRIIQLPSDPQAPIDWTFERLTDGRGELRPYEQLLLDAVAPLDGERVLASGIHEAVGPVIADVQDALYDDVVAEGWFEKRPDSARNSYQMMGWVAVALALVATGLLAAFTHFGLLGLALLVLALGLVFVAQEMPRRSAKGSELLAGLHGLASLLQHQRTDQMPPGRELHEISEVLPYAVVLGGKERWIQALVDADPDEGADSTTLDWYHAPQDWHLQHLPASLDAFITAVQGRLFGR